MSGDSIAAKQVDTPAGSSIRLLYVALAIGLIARLVPLFDHAGRLLKQWPTEDGYLTLTIARNLALGRGFSVSEGTIATNGTQPLVTLLYAGGFWLTDGDRRLGVTLALAWQVVAALTTALVLRRLVLSFLGDHQRRHFVANLAACLWFLHPVVVPHTMNCLETGTLLLLAGATWLSWWRWQYEEQGRPSHLGALRLSAFLGLLGAARIDSVFFMGALAAAHLVLARERGHLRRAVGEVAIMALGPILLVGPWLLYGKLTFDHWMPISGIAEGHFASFGDHAVLIPAKLLEYALPLGVPSAVEGKPLVAAGCLVVLLTLGWLLLRVLEREGTTLRGIAPERRAVLVFALLMLLTYGGYYGLLFGADHFLSRYWVLFSLGTVPVFAYFVDRLMARSGALLCSATGVILASILLFQQSRLYRHGSDHMHWQVVEWTAQHVPNETWVGAIQTGTLGFFHERTLNLDGKVNPHALEAKLAGIHHEYIVQSSVQALIDWAGVANLLEHGPTIDHAFRLRVLDRERNLGVLVRKGGTLDVGSTP